MNSKGAYQVGWYSFLMVFFIIFGVCTWWLFYPYEPIVVDYIKIVNPEKAVMQGHVLTYEIKYTKKMHITGTLTRKLRNSYVIELSDVAATAVVGKDTERISIPIPRFADPGEYDMSWSVTYPVNPLRRVTVQKNSDKFMVVCNPEWLGKQGEKGEQGKQGIHGAKGDKGDKGGISFFPGGKK